ncbi:MAG: SRPBCC family protein [Dermatophilaceae bacterium]
MAQFECHITMARPVSEVFALLLDPANTHYFDPGVKSVQQITPGTIGVGTSFRFRERIPPFGRYGLASATYTAIEPNRQIVFDFEVGPVRGSGSFLFDQEHTGTRLTFRGRMRPPWPLKPLAPMLARQGQRTWQTRLEWIKDWMEAGAPRDMPAAQAERSRS